MLFFVHFLLVDSSKPADTGLSTLENWVGQQIDFVPSQESDVNAYPCNSAYDCCLDTEMDNCFPYHIFKPSCVCLSLRFKCPVPGFIHPKANLRKAISAAKTNPGNSCLCLTESLILYPITCSVDAGLVAAQAAVSTSLTSVCFLGECARCKLGRFCNRRHIYEFFLKGCLLNDCLCRHQSEICPDIIQMIEYDPIKQYEKDENSVTSNDDCC
jgi:hypothetical protein